MEVKAYKEIGFLVVAALEEGTKFAYYLYRNQELLETRPYTSAAATVFEISEPGKYQAKAFKYSVDGELARGWSDTIEFQIQDVNLNNSDIELPRCKEDWEHWIKLLSRVRISDENPWYVLDPTTDTAQSIMESGWVMPGFPPINPISRIDWGEAGRINRSWGFHLHAWEFIDPVMDAYQRTKSPELLEWMLKVASQWWDFAQKVSDESAMVWYDMSLSLRTPRLVRLLVLTSKSDVPERTKRLIEPLLKHAEMLFSPDAFNSYNNHGFFTAAATVELTKLMPFIPWSDSLAQIGENRMSIMVDKQFAEDGGHVEHSPDYHRMLLGSFEKALSAGLIAGEEIAKRIELAANVLGWMVQPNGTLVQFGDSEAFDVDLHTLHSIDENTEFILSNGARGRPTERELCTLPQSGFAFVRTPQPRHLNTREESGYLAFQAGFHSRAHKHADDLTFVWCDKGREIIVDSGRFGYAQQLPADAPERKMGFYYGAPERMYVESTIAHNTVEVGGTDIERRQRRPYGSALGKCTNTGNRFIIRGAVEHKDYLHERMLRYQRGNRLQVIDTITPKASEISAISWFNINGEFEAEVRDNFVIFRPPNATFVIKVSSEGELVEPVRGQHSPMRGWRSKIDRELVPVWNFGFKKVVTKRVRQQVLFEIIELSLE